MCARHFTWAYKDLLRQHICPAEAGLKRTPGQMDQAASSKVSRDEVHPPPRCCCYSKSLESKFLDLIIVMNLFQAANAWDAKKTFLERNDEVEALSCKNGQDILADGQEVSRNIFTNENHQI